MAAPTATTSSGFTPLDGVLPKNSFTNSWIAGIRVEPPTKITSSISFGVIPASLSAFLQGSKVPLIKRSANCSNFARVNLRTKCLGTPSTAVI